MCAVGTMGGQSGKNKIPGVVNDLSARWRGHHGAMSRIPRELFLL